MVSIKTTDTPPSTSSVGHVDYVGGGSKTTYSTDGVERRVVRTISGGGGGGGSGSGSWTVSKPKVYKATTGETFKSQTELDSFLRARQIEQAQAAIQKAKDLRDRRQSTVAGGSGVTTSRYTPQQYSQAEIQQPTTPERRGYSRGTQTYEPEQKKYNVYMKPTIYSKQIGTIRDPKTGRLIPEYEIRYSGGSLSKKQGQVEDREATEEEKQEFLKATRTAEEGKRSTLVGKAKTVYAKSKVRGEETLQPVVNVVQKGEEIVVKAIKQPSPSEMVFGESKQAKVRKEFQAGIARGIIPSTAGEVAITAASLGIGSAIGAGARLSGAVATKVIPKVAPVVSKGVGVAGLGLGATYAGGKTLQLASAESVEEAGEIVGGTGRELVAFGGGYKAGSKVTGKAIGLYRTRGLTEVPAEEVIAPEYFKGQTYPAIKKGQTAGELVKEFKPKLPGETKPAGYTAAPSPLTGKEIGKGSSELPGLYQAPDLSPKFLGLSKGEFSYKQLLEGLPGGLPTAFRTTPTSFELVPGIKPGQRSLAKLGETKAFFEKAEKGKSYIPFVKTEKEAVIPFETKFRKTGKKYYLEFEGERIPIQQVETLPSKPLKIKKKVVEITPETIKAYSRSTSSKPLLSYSGSSISSSLSKLYSSPSYPRYSSVTKRLTSPSSISKSKLSTSVGKSSSYLSSSISSYSPSKYKSSYYEPIVKEPSYTPRKIGSPFSYYAKGKQPTPKKIAPTGKKTPGYSASLAAAAFQAKPVQVTRKQYEQLAKKTYSGFEARPVLEIVDFNSNSMKGAKAVAF